NARGEFAHREPKIRTLGVRMHRAHRFSVTAGSSSTSGSVRMIGRSPSCTDLLTPAQTNGPGPHVDVAAYEGRTSPRPPRRVVSACSCSRGGSVFHLKSNRP